MKKRRMKERKEGKESFMAVSIIQDFSKNFMTELCIYSLLPYYA